MKNTFHRDEPARNPGYARHYHRKATTDQQTWDEWINGKSTSKRVIKWLKILLVVVAGLIFVAIVVGLFIELQ